MDTKILYSIWLLIPGVFFLIALWAKLEQLSKSAKKQNPGDFLRQGFFLLGCVVLAILIDRFVLTSLADSTLTEWVPIGVMQFLLLPFILAVGATLMGGSKQISIKNPSGTHRQKKK